MARTKRLIEDIKDTERTTLALLWENPFLYRQTKKYKITEKTFTSRNFWIYFRYGLSMYDKGFKVFDEVACDDFGNKNPNAYKQFNQAGGFANIQELFDLLNETQTEISEKNFEVYLKEIVKFDTLRQFEDKGVVNYQHEGLLDNLIATPLEDLGSVLRQIISQVTLNVSNSKNVVSEMFQETEMYEYIENAGKGPEDGVNIGSNRLNYLLNSWQKGKMIQTIMSSGLGKSTFIRSIWIPALLRAGKSYCLFINEEDKATWEQQMIITIANQELLRPFGGHLISKKKYFAGECTDEEKAMLKQAAKKLAEYKENGQLKIEVVETQAYTMNGVLEHLETHEYNNYDAIIVDTFKPSMSDSTYNSTQRWENFAGDAQKLYDYIKPSYANKRCLVTAQMRIGYKERYLGLDSTGKSKEIVEIADTVLLFREVYSDEYPNEAYDLKPYKWVPKQDGSPGFDKRYVQLNPELSPSEKYVIMFLGKNRNGSTGEQIIYKVNYDFNTFDEVGFCNMKQVGV